MLTICQEIMQSNYVLLYRTLCSNCADLRPFGSLVICPTVRALGETRAQLANPGPIRQLTRVGIMD